jgi:hypothetical protein
MSCDRFLGGKRLGGREEGFVVREMGGILGVGEESVLC